MLSYFNTNRNKRNISNKVLRMKKISKFSLYANDCSNSRYMLVMTINDYLEANNNKLQRIKILISRKSGSSEIYLFKCD